MTKTLKQERAEARRAWLEFKRAFNEAYPGTVDRFVWLLEELLRISQRLRKRSATRK